MKNPQFLPNQADILPSEFIHWTDILTKFHNNWTKIVDFLVIAFYFPGWTFFWIWSQCESWLKASTTESASFDVWYETSLDKFYHGFMQIFHLTEYFSYA